MAHRLHRCISDFLWRREIERSVQVIDVNLKGTFLVTQTAASLMKEQKLAGSIVNIASIVGRTGNIGQVRREHSETLKKSISLKFWVRNTLKESSGGFRQTTQRARQAWLGSPRQRPKSSASSASESMSSCQVLKCHTRKISMSMLIVLTAGNRRYKHIFVTYSLNFKAGLGVLDHNWTLFWKIIFSSDSICSASIDPLQLFQFSLSP